MLVYGDHSEHADPRERLDAIARELKHVRGMPAGIWRHAKLVRAMIASGQLLQGVADADFECCGADRTSDASEAIGRFLLALAQAVARSWNSSFEEIGELPHAPSVDLPHGVELRTPEGFAFYALYPEAYFEAARRLALCGPPGIIGIRSIGATIGAMVAAALDAPPPVTVRPHGDPFARELSIAPDLERQLLGSEAHYVIVDEGPGQSGSSFGAVADWLDDRGVPRSRIAFVPSHPGEPGPQASARHRQRWAQAQRVSGDFAHQLPQLLERWLTDLLGPLDAPLVDMSGGAWRRHVYADERDWPAAMPPFERRKFLARANGQPLLVKFAGLGASGERKLGMARALHSAGLTPEPIGLVHGFIVEQWRDDAQPLLPGERPVDGIAAYLGARARLFPAQPDEGASLAQLLEMARRNISLALGGGRCAILDQWQEAVGTLSRRVVRVRTDNKLDHFEWLRTCDGRLLKTDALDHHAAHDLVGCQDLAWDVAGAIAEFALDEDEAWTLVNETERAAGRHVDRELLDFYCIAYLSFRLGQVSGAMDMSAPDAVEDQRLSRRRGGYAAGLRQLLPLESTPFTTRPTSLVD